MDRKPTRPLLITAVVLAFVVPTVVVGGLLERMYVRDAFASSEQTLTLRSTAFASLRYQLDEETGIRGFTVTRDPAFLEPFNRGSADLTVSLSKLIHDTGALHDGTSELALDAAETNNRWVQTVATPLRTQNVRGSYALQVRGKALVDRFRVDIKQIAAKLDAREIAIDAAAQTTVNRIILLTLAVVLLIVAASFTFAVQQSRLALRLEQERSRVEEEARRNAELRSAYVAEKRIADTLQEAFSQRPLPTHPLLRFSAAYVPATEEAKVGGDWYDAIELADQRVMFSLGDVEGHGIDAAVAMSRTRQALISSALVGADPVAILGRVNSELLRTGSRMVTAVVGFADPQSYAFVYATAGHPPPILLEPGRKPRMLSCGGLPLGILADIGYTTFRVQSVPGALLVLYTDGAVEHSRDVLEGEETLLRAIASASQSAEPDLATRIHHTIFGDRPVGDDVAILTVGFDASEAPRLSVSSEFARTSVAGRIDLGASPSAVLHEARARDSQLGRRRVA